MQNGTLNGFEVQELKGSIKAVEEKPAIAAFTFRAQNHWITGGINHTVIDNYDGLGETQTRAKPFSLFNDSDPDEVPNPVEMLLHALAGCITSALASHAALQGIRLDEVETKFSGEMDLRGFLGIDKDVRSGYKQVSVAVKIGGDAKESRLTELVALATKRSPVFDVVNNGVPVDVTVNAISTTVIEMDLISQAA